MITQSITEARRKLGELIDLAHKGEDVVIIKDSRPVAKLTPIDASDLQLVRLSPAQQRRLSAWIKSEPKKTFPNAEAAVRFLRKESKRRG